MASSPRIDELRKKFEENPRRYFAPLANEYRKAGDVQQAIAICREYLPQQPGHMSGHIVFGQALYEARTFEEAKTVFETALSLDPENLIALRHLGDIALITGDSENAKIWYKRVLEADPRNEEIQAQLATIEQAASSAPTPAITPAVPEAPAPPPSAPKAATPSSAAPTVVMKAVQPPSRTPAPTTATSPTAEINLDAITPPAAPPSAVAPTVEVPQIIPPEPVVEASPATLEGLEGTQAAGVGEASASGFSLDGLETTSLSTESAAPMAAPIADLDFGPAGAPPAPEPAAPTIDLDFGAPAAPVAAAPAPEALPDLDFAPPAPPAPTPVVAAPVIDAEAPALDLDLGSLGAAAAPAAPTPAPMAEAAPPVANTADDAPLDLEISLPTPSPVAAAIPEPEAPPVTPAQPPVASPVAEAHAPMEVEAPETPVTTSAPFVTETMADLYVQQGHRDEALRVYRALLEQRPGDSGILDKIARLTGPATDAAPAPAASTGPSIRELLFAIAARRPGYRPEFPSTNGSHASAPPAASAPAQDSPPAAPSVATAPSELESRDDSLGAALGFAGSSGHDEAAARLLARAFIRNGRGHGATAVGAPARQASDDLSLRTVFKDGEPAPPPSSFSFDQFFSQRASAEGRAVSPEGQAAESAEDVAHFTQWLEGLKKR
jgi:hypothetical protein